MDQKARTVTLEFDLAQAYLEMARAHHGMPVVGPCDANADEVTFTNNTAIALVAHGYVFSFMALNAFVTGCLWQVWEVKNSPLRLKYPNVSDFRHLLKTDLRELKDCISELCPYLGARPLHEAEPALWNRLLQVLKSTRDFMTHPSPDSVEFNKIIGDALEKHNWSFPARIVEAVIEYLLKNQPKEMPEWLRENREFRFEGLRALKVKPRP